VKYDQQAKVEDLIKAVKGAPGMHSYDAKVKTLPGPHADRATFRLPTWDQNWRQRYINLAAYPIQAF
jgi:hypothetical protein